MVFRLVSRIDLGVVFGLASVALLTSGCAKRGGQRDVIGVSPHVELAEREQEEAAPVEKHVDERTVPDAARPFTGYRPVDDKSFERESFLTHLAAADAVCIGETHDDALDHYAELAVLEALVERRPMRGFELGLGLEMVRRQSQAALSSYAERDFEIAEFSQKVNWAEEWGFPIEYYAPTLQTGRDQGATLLALGVKRDLTTKIATVGIEGLSPVEQRELPSDMDFLATEHRALFDALTRDHRHGDPNRMYAAQVVWDESMADTSASFLAARAPGRKLLILAGKAHCHHLGIPSRVERRGDFRVVSVVPVEGQPVKAKPLSAQSTADDRLLAGYDYQLVFGAKD